MKKFLVVLICLITLITSVAGCTGSNNSQNGESNSPQGSLTQGEYSKFSDAFFDAFDTVITVMAYARSEEEFNALFAEAHDSFLEMHKLFDIYHEYEGINNIKTINDNAGIAPVKVDSRIIGLIKESKEWYEKADGKVNIALGSVLSIWHNYREAGLDDPVNAQLPPMEDLVAASKHTDIANVIIDEAASTVYLADSEMSLDVGAVAKGYATEIVAEQLQQSGYGSVLISAGGNIRAIGKPLDGVRSKWGVGIKDPDSLLANSTDEANLLDVAFVTDTSVVSSGVYERYYVVDGQKYHHIIDPETLMPGGNYKAVTIVTKNSADADALSTALFLMPPEQSLAFVESLEGTEALWVMSDNTIVYSSGMKQMLRDAGGATSK